MTREEILAVLARKQAAMAGRDFAGIASLYADACVVESPTAGGLVTGRTALARLEEAWATAFPDLVITSDEPLIDGDRAAQVVTFEGTDTGVFLGLPPTGKTFRMPIVVLSTFKDQQIVHERRIYDFTGFLLQIGVLKAKPAV